MDPFHNQHDFFILYLVGVIVIPLVVSQFIDWHLKELYDDVTETIVILAILTLSWPISIPFLIICFIAYLLFIGLTWPARHFQSKKRKY